MNTKIHFAFTGDLMLGGSFLPYAQKHKTNLLSPFQSLEQNLSEADIVLINLEGPLAHRSQSRSDKEVILANHLECLDFIKSFKLPIINLANNHIMDYGEDGLNETLGLLQKNRVGYIGAGNNEQQANSELIVESKGKRIAFLSYTSDGPDVGADIATSQKAGCASFAELDRITSKIKKMKESVDIVCVSLHWGKEYFLYPANSQVETAHFLVEAGASFIIGHHPHVLQGIENYKGALIAYSLGNFFMPAFRQQSGRMKMQESLEKEFMLLLAEIEDNGKIKYDTVGGLVNKHFRMKPYTNRKLEKFRKKIKKVSRPLDLPHYDIFWQNYKSQREKELRRRTLLFAFKKLSRMSFSDLKTITPGDFKRQFARLGGMIFRRSFIKKNLAPNKVINRTQRK